MSDTLPLPTNLPEFTVMYYGGNLNYYAGTDGWIPITTAGEFTVVQADNQPTTYTLGAWTAKIGDQEINFKNLQQQVQQLLIQVSNLNTNVAALTQQMQAVPATIVANVQAYMKGSV